MVENIANRFIWLKEVRNFISKLLMVKYTKTNIVKNLAADASKNVYLIQIKMNLNCMRVKLK